MTYRLPDGQVFLFMHLALANLVVQAIDVTDAVSRSHDVLLDPALMDIEALGLHELAWNALMKCDIDTRKDLAFNIILSGAPASFPGLADGITDRIRPLVSRIYFFNYFI